MQNKLILYIGEREAGQALAAAVEPQGGYVYQPETLMQALGMYITYFPQVVIVDPALEWGEEVYEHLRSVDARPILLLSDTRVRDAAVYTAPRSLSAQRLLDVIERLGEPLPASNGVLRYA